MGISRLPGWRTAATAPQGAAAAGPRLLPRAAGLRMHAARMHAKAWACLGFAAFVLPAWPAPPNTSIVNTATVNFQVSGVPVTVAGSATVVTVAGTPATIVLLSSADGTQGLPSTVTATRNVAPTQCGTAGGGWTTLAAPVAPGQGT